jgi:phospholipid N-methyltransferase
MLATKGDSLAVPRSAGRLLYLRKFLRDHRRVATVAPSSRMLARAVAAPIEADRPQTIVELGAGDGAITAAALERMHPESRLVAIELDPQLAELLRQRCPRAEVVIGDVADLPRQLDRLRVANVDVLLSSLPLPHLPRTANAAIFGTLERLSPDGWFSQQTLVPYVYRRMYRRLFHHVQLRLAPLNLPPAGAYHCRGLREDYSDWLPGTRV